MLVPILTIVCAVFLAAFFLLLPGASTEAQRAPFWGLNCAHRGLHTRDLTIPENSIAAFTAAVDAGYGIELDIRLSSDGEVVVFHDETLQRMCGIAGRVEEKPFHELRELPLLDSNQRIPLLRDALELIDSRVPLIIELKTTKLYKKLCQSAWRILRQYDGDICIESFDPRIVRWFKKQAPGLLRGQLSAPASLLDRGLQGYVVSWLLCNFLGRPHFIAYHKGHHPLPVRLVQRFAMRMVWTAGPEDAAVLLEDENDTVIFEFYEPEPRYKETPGLLSPDEEEYRF